MHFPQRILIGAMALVALGLGAGPAHADNDATVSKPLQKTLTVPADTQVVIENMAGAVNVTQGGAQLEVNATVVAAGESQAAAQSLANTIRLETTRDAGRVVIHVHYPVDAHTRYAYRPTHPDRGEHHGLSLFGLHFGSSSSTFTYQGQRVSVYQGKDKGVPLHVDLDIKVPAGSHIAVDNRMGRMHARDLQADVGLKTASGDIDASTITGDLKIDSGSGDIKVADVKGTLAVNTGSGDIALKQTQGTMHVGTGSGDINGNDIHGDELSIKTGSGDILLSDVSGNVNADTGSGDIGLNDLRAIAHARFSSGSGDINVKGDLSGLTDFRMSSGSGDITLTSATPPAVHLEIRGSDIDVHWPGLSHVETGRHHYRADLGAATGQGRIDTGSGDVTLRN